MLVLGRRDAQQVIMTIPPSDKERQIVLTLLQTGKKGRRDTRLGFDADRDVLIMRGELVHQVTPVKDKQ